jgi:hypothetical protein
MYRMPAESTAIPFGKFSSALTAGELSPVAAPAQACDGGHHTIGHLAHTAGVGVGDVEIAGSVDGDSMRSAELGVDRQNPVGAVSPGAIACDRGDDAAGDLADTEIARVGDIQIARRIEGQTGRAGLAERWLPDRYPRHRPPGHFRRLRTTRLWPRPVAALCTAMKTLPRGSTATASGVPPRLADVAGTLAASPPPANVETL